MKPHQVTWICVLGVSTFVGLFLAGMATRGPEPPEAPLVESSDLSDDVVFVPSGDDFDLGFPVDVADLEVEESSFPTAPPEVLPEPEDAVPIPPGSVEVEEPPAEPAPPAVARPVPEDVLRSLIDHELPNATDEERKAWFEEMRGLPADMLAEVLRIRKDLGSLVPRTRFPPIEVEIVEPPASEPSPAEELVVDVPAVSTSPTPSVRLTEIERRPLENTLTAIGRARRVLLNNVANVNSPGYLRRRPRIVELPPTETAGSRVENGSGFGGSWIDTTPGPLVATERLLDVAVAGPAFLVFATEDGTLRYRRCASLRVGPEGQLVSSEGHSVEPAISLPDSTTVVAIAADGTVTADVLGTGVEEVGALQLALFENPEELRPVGNGYFEEVEASGSSTVGSPGDRRFGTVQAGFLAGSNVDPEHERRELQRLGRQEAFVRELLGDEAPTPEPPPLIARPPAEQGRQTSAVSDGTGPRLVVRPDMLPF